MNKDNATAWTQDGGLLNRTCQTRRCQGGRTRLACQNCLISNQKSYLSTKSYSYPMRLLKRNFAVAISAAMVCVCVFFY